MNYHKHDSKKEVKMDHSNSNTDSRQKGRHFTIKDRCLIEAYHNQKYSNRAIARRLNCSPGSIGYELKRGSKITPNSHRKRYIAEVGQDAYDNNRKHCGRKIEFFKHRRFMEYVVKHFHQNDWSLDACVGRALVVDGFSKDEVVSTKTLYKYVDQRLLGIINLDLPMKTTRSTKQHRVRQNLRKLGCSIDERDPKIELREEFGHWECDLVLGKKTKDDEVLLTLCERKTRMFLVIKIPDKTADSVMAAFKELRKEYGAKWDQIFKSITTDNGSEFAKLSDLEAVSKTLVYYAHPYTSCDKGSVERHNGIIRRFIPKGERIDKYSIDDIFGIQMWCNSLPRKILNYSTPEELFDSEMDKIYQI